MASYNTPNFNGAESTQHPRVDENGVPLCEPSICIPRVFPNITDRRIFAIFRELRVGFVEKIDMVERTGKDGKDYNMVFVHFRNWFTNDEMAMEMRDRLLNGDQVKIVYDEPWFWKIHAYVPKKQRQTQERQGRRPAPFVDFEFREQVKQTSSKSNGQRPAPPTYSPPKIDAKVPPPNIYSALAVETTNDSDENTPPSSPSYSPEEEQLEVIQEE